MQKNSTNKKFNFVIEGNIGSGKSTFLSLIKEALDVSIIYEPTDKWQNVDNSGNLLELFYKDISRWAYTFQSYAFITRVQAHLEQAMTSEKKVIISERSIYCDRFCFGKNCYESGNMSDLEWSLYKEWFSWITQHCLEKPTAFIYLQTSPETCFKRLKKRNRCEESSVPLSYLRALHEKHENWLVNKNEAESSFLSDVPVLVVDCNEEFETDLAIQTSLIEQVESFINITIPSEEKNNECSKLFIQQSQVC